MLKIDDVTIEIIADRIVDLIKQGKLLKRDAEGGDGWQSKENLEALWYNYIKRVDPYEKRYIEIIKYLLAKQAKEVFDNIKKYPNSYKKWMFDKKYWLREFTDAEAKFIVKLYKQEGQKAIDLALKLSRKSYYKAEEIPISMAFDVYNPEVTSELLKQTRRFPAGVVGTSEEIIRREIANGLELGESIDKLRKRVTERLGPTYIKNRAEMIARSETIYASNAGAELGYMQSGVVEGKKWLTAVDERTCFLANTKITTNKGYIPIQDIKIGNLVLTHKDRYKKVIKLYHRKYDGNVVRITLKGDNIRLTATENHPILVDGKWIEVRNIKQGDRVNYFSIQNCFIGVEVKKVEKWKLKKNQAVYNLGVEDDNTYTANKIVVHNCDPCIDMNNMTAPIGQPTWEKEGLDIGDVQGKYGLDFDYTEGAMPFPPLHPRCLIDGQIKIYTSKGWRPIRGITIGDLVLTHRGRFKKVTQLHFTPKQKPNVVKLIIDNKRQQIKLSVTENHPILIDNRWVVARDVKVGDEINYLKRIILNHKGGYKFIPLKIKRIERWKLNRPRMLYNLSVEDDESYIANGFVIHNCRCTITPIVKMVTKPPPRRGHLPQDMTSRQINRQLVKDAKRQGLALTLDEADYIQSGVRNYTRGSYSDIRKIQRGVIPDYWTPTYEKLMREQAKTVDDFIKYSAKYKEEIIYRGIEIDASIVKKFRKGQIIDMGGTASFSSDPLAAAKFGNIQFRVKNKTGVSIAHMSGHAEGEIIISKNVKFKITKIEEVAKDIMDIYIEEL